MYATKKTVNSREAFTLVELLVVIAIILAISALAAAFAPRVNDSTNLTRAVDNLEQWLLTAKMRAKRDGLATGVRFVQAPGDATITPGPAYSQLQYIQQPDPLSGGYLVFVQTGVTPPPGSTLYQSVTGGAIYLSGGMLTSASSPAQASGATGTVTLNNVDVTMGGNLPTTQYLILPGDYLELRDGGVFYISGANSTLSTPPVTTLSLTSTSGYDAVLNNITTLTTNYRILRQPRILIGEEPLVLPNNYAVNFATLPGTASAGCNVNLGTSGLPEILFSPTGAVVGSNAGNGKVLISVYDQTMSPFDINKVGIIAVQCSTGFIGAYSVAPGVDPFAYAESGQESGL
jgi:prepilin-type N-terminal cleavage/methylation domain-containing protein